MEASTTTTPATEEKKEEENQVSLLSSPDTGSQGGEADAYYAKLRDFYDEWSTYQAEVEKLKEEDDVARGFGYTLFCLFSHI
jgi:hypothetical protein